MFEIREKERHLNDETLIRTFSREVVSANILEAEAGTTGYRGGDSGHGGRTYFSIRDLSCSDMEVKILKDRFGEPSGFEVYLGGDTELETIITSLKFITKVLEDEAAEVND